MKLKGLHRDDTQTFHYDKLKNTLKMSCVGNWTMHYDYQDQLINAGNGTFTSYYNYNSEGKRTRKVVVKNNIVETRYYINGYEIYRKKVNGVIDVERLTVNISDDSKVFVRIEKKSDEDEVIRYQYDNHLGSACLELDVSGLIISYEEYHPFGTTSYRSGANEVDVSLKRYKYCGKERDEETGLYYYGMRYYAAWLCRFINVDPLQFKYPYYTPFQYAGNKPITYIDLDGTEEIKASDKLKKEKEIYDVFTKISTTKVFKKLLKKVITEIDYDKVEEYKDGKKYYPLGQSRGGKVIINEYFYKPGTMYDNTLVGKTMIHELMHERMTLLLKKYLFEKDGELKFREYDFMHDYPGFAESMKKYGWKDDKESNRGWQHNWMAKYGRDDIIEVMKYLDAMYGISRETSEYSAEDWYKAISFSGLKNTDVWNNLNDETKALYTKIIEEANQEVITGGTLEEYIISAPKIDNSKNIQNDTIKK